MGLCWVWSSNNIRITRFGVKAPTTLFSSHETKSQVSFTDPTSSVVVCLFVRSSLTFHLKDYSYSFLPILIKLGIYVLQNCIWIRNLTTRCPEGSNFKTLLLLQIFSYNKTIWIFGILITSFIRIVFGLKIWQTIFGLRVLGSKFSISIYSVISSNSFKRLLVLHFSSNFN